MTFSCGEEEITDAAGMRLRGGHLAPSFFFFCGNPAGRRKFGGIIWAQRLLEMTQQRIRIKSWRRRRRRRDKTLQISFLLLKELPFSQFTLSGRRAGKTSDV